MVMRFSWSMTATSHIESQRSDRFATEPLDMLARLDHHTRGQALRVEDAEPGRYLELEGRDGSRLLALDDPMIYVGRSFTSGLRFDDHSVSRRHAIFVRRAGRTRILDDRSLNGTFVNGRRVEEAELTDGDVVVLGSIVLVYREL
jgi:pSer/pThr/pTyr-binding forkhead associated (FHA) protein